MKFAFKVTRTISKRKVVVTNLALLPDNTEPYLRETPDMVEVLHVYDNKVDARTSRSWEVVAAHFHHFTPAHLASIVAEDLARARALAIPEATLTLWTGRSQSYYSHAVKAKRVEPRKAAKLHIVIGLLEQLHDRAVKTLTDEMRPNVR